MFKITDYLEKLESAIERDRENLKHAPSGSPARAELDGQSKLVAMLKSDLADSPAEGRTEKRQGNASQNSSGCLERRMCGMSDALGALASALPKTNQLTEE